MDQDNKRNRVRDKQCSKSFKQLVVEEYLSSYRAKSSIADQYDVSGRGSTLSKWIVP